MKQRDEHCVLDLLEVKQATDPVLSERRDAGLLVAARVLERLARKMRALDNGKISALTEQDIITLRQLGVSPTEPMSYAEALGFARAVLDVQQMHADEDNLLLASAEELELRAATLKSCEEVEEAQTLEELAAVHRQLSACSVQEETTRPDEDGESIRDWALRGARMVLDAARQDRGVH